MPKAIKHKPKPPIASDQKKNQNRYSLYTRSIWIHKKDSLPSCHWDHLQTTKHLKKILSRPKDTIPTTMKFGVVYQISCQDCIASYIGQTDRNLSQGITEHRRAVKKLDIFLSTMSEHVCQTCLSINWDNPSILAHHSFV